MNCAGWEERIALYLGGDLPAVQASEVERHLGECAGCQVFAGGMREALELLHEAHTEKPSEAHFAAVRARVISELERSHRPLWARLLPWSAVAASLLFGVAVVRLYRPVPAPPELAIAPPRAPVSAYRQTVHRPEPPARRVVAVPTPKHEVASEPVMIRLVTDDPDVVIYWIADEKGE